METDDIKLYGSSDSRLMEMIGHFIKETRLQQNKTQQDIATAAGLNRSTLVLLEKGNGGTLSTLIQVLRVLERLDVLQSFVAERPISPLMLAEMEQKYRRRARHAQPDTKNDIDTDW